jgi:hypothetical protein
MVCLIQRQEHLKAQAEDRRFSVDSSSTKPTLQVVLLLKGYSTSESCDAFFAYVASTYQKQASVTPLLDLLLVGIKTILKGLIIFPDSGRVGSSSSNYSALPSLQALDLHPRA